ncbi:phage tail tape measure protein [Streptomyces sp. NPDC007971]|uniref:phage tail tape measure protein n=1 Tax=Streptomyces sp. NPDC007971 TaxID=3364799 RepID=UPI0036E3C70E
MSANVVEILVTAKDLASPTMARLNAQVEGASKGMAVFHKTALIAGAGLVAMGAESVKMAAKFDASMTQLHTQAGVSQDKIAGLKKGVLDLAGKVGQDPDSLAESLYHVESNFESTGISGTKALKLVETAAKGATIGHADLVDVTNALTAAVASGIPGVENFDKAMGTLNATVGTGDMKMQDLADAFGTGMLAAVKGYGVTIQDVGAGLAVFGDNNVRGAKAGTEFRMMIQGLAHPVATAKDELSKLGLAQDDLAKDMQKGGLNAAMKDLVGRMKAAGVSSKEQGQVITDLFGKKAGQGISMLVSEFDKLESKYPAGIAGANKFGEAWAATQKTFAFQTKALQASFDALMITLGNKLIPPLQAFVSLLLAHKGATVAATAALAGLLAATVAVSAAMKVAAAASMLWAAGGRAVAALQGVFEGVALRAMYMKEAFIAAGGGVAGLKAAFAGLGAIGKASVVVGGLALLAIAVSKIADLGKTAPPDVDKLTTSLKNLASSGKFSGELQKTFGDMDGLVAKVGELNHKSAQMSSTPFGFRIPGLDDIADKIKSAVHNVTDGKDSLDALKGDFNSLDKSLAGMASNGFADSAAKDFTRMSTALKSAGYSTKDINRLFPTYTSSLKGLKAEQELTADSMGLFGKAAVSTQKNLDAEAQSAKGLEQSIMALNAVHRGAFDAETAFYQAMSDAQKAVKENGRTLNVNSEAGRKNRDVLSQLAAKTEDLVDKKMKEKVSWDQVDKTYQKGRKSLIDAAMAMGDTKKQAEELADAILKAPDAKKFQFKVDDKQAAADLNAFNAAVKKTPGAKSVTLKTLSKTAEQVLEAFGFKVKRLPNGSVKVTAATGAALAAIRNVAGAVNALHGKTVGIGVYTTHYYKTVQQGGVHSGPQLPGMPGAARGGLLRGYAAGGDVQMFPDGGYVQGPGSGTSDSILALMGSGAMARVSNTEYVMKADAVRKYGVKFFDALNEGRLHVSGFARGGHLTKAQRRAQQRAKQARQRAIEQAKAEKEARGQLSSEFGISYFGRLAGYKRTPFEHNVGAPTDINALVSSLNEAAGKIKAAFHGRTETNLLRHLNSVGKSLISHEKALTKVTASLDKAKDKLNSLKDSASQLSDSVKSNLISSANITKAASGAEGGTLTLSAVRAGMVVSRDKVIAFANALKALKAKGFSKSVIQQVAEAGIDGGGLETAGALLQASGSEVKSINAMQGQIESAAGSAGKTTADTVYGKAIKDQTAAVKKLTHQQARLEKAMADLAKAMEKLIQKAFKGKATGGVVGMAAAGGLRSDLTWVGEQGPELLDLPAGSRVWSNADSRRMAQAQTPWASMLTTQQRAHAAAASVAPARQEHVVVLEIRAGDSGQYTEFLVGQLRKAVRVRGSVEATLAPPRGR